MSDKDYLTEEERRPGRGSPRRRAHDMSSSSNEEDVGTSECSPVNDRSDGDEGGETDSTEEVAAKDVAGPQLSKETVMEAMKGAKRVNKVAPNLILNQTILDHYHNVRMDDQDQGPPLIIIHQELLGGGDWTAKANKKIREKYFISREQHIRMEAPTLKVGINTRSL